MTAESGDTGFRGNLSGSGFGLALDWGAGADGQPIITGVHKTAPGMSESWAPVYTGVDKLDSMTITRTTGSGTQVIGERYGISQFGIPSKLERDLDGINILTMTKTLDQPSLRVSALTYTYLDEQGLPSEDKQVFSYSPRGNLIGIDTQIIDQGSDPQGAFPQWWLDWDGHRQLFNMQGLKGLDDPYPYQSHHYDHDRRRIDRTSPNVGGRLVYAYHGSRLIAVGQQNWTSDLVVGATPKPAGEPTWLYAIGWGPDGPVFLADLVNGEDYFILSDHLGTPWAYKNLETNQVYFTPFNAWGELLAYDETRWMETRPFDHGNIPVTGFQLLPNQVWDIISLGLGGHHYDRITALTYMHHRYYHPRLGHFISPDFRAPDIFDPSTYKHPYAYANGNPILFWDPDGLKDILYWAGKAEYSLRIPDEEWIAMLHGEIGFMGISLPLLERIETKTKYKNIGWMTAVCENCNEIRDYKSELAARDSFLYRFIREYMSETAEVRLSVLEETWGMSIKEKLNISANRTSVYKTLANQGLIHLLSGNREDPFFVGVGYFLEASSSQVFPRILHYLEFSLERDLAIASMFTTAGEMGILIKSITRPSSGLLANSFDEILPSADDFLTYYHGTSKEGAKSIRESGINLRVGNPTADFGQGFYLAPTREAAEWSAKRLYDEFEIVEFRVAKSQIDDLDILIFDSATDSWADFIKFHKKYGPDKLLHGTQPYDMVIGPMFRRYGKKGVKAWPDRLQFSIHTRKATDIFNRSVVK